MSNHKRKARDQNPMIAAAQVEGEAREARIDVEAKKNPNHEHLYLHLSLVQELFSLISHAPPSTRFIANPEIARRLILQREIFRLLNKPIVVKVGFHYTKTRGMNKGRLEQIMQDGLIPSRCNRFFGSGIYLAENPQAFSTYGDKGILVLYIPGTVQLLGRKEASDLHADADSFRGNKLSKTDSKVGFNEAAKTAYFDEIVVKRGDQVLPVFAYPRSAVNNADHLHRFHQKVQELVDRTVNYVEDYNGSSKHMVPRKTPVPRIFPSYDELHFEQRLYELQKKNYEEPTRLVFFHDGTVVEKWN